MLRNQIITEARSWTGTKFVHQGRMKKSAGDKGGCDCVGLVIGVVAALDIKCEKAGGVAFTDLVEANYGRRPDGQLLKNTLDKYLYPVALDKIKPGDVLLLKIKNEPQHVAFVGDYSGGGLSMIHCYIRARGVVEHALDSHWLDRAVMGYGFFSWIGGYS